jgi:dinuclear metal center YbgI/SA1388 family protein
MQTLAEIINVLETFAPLDLQEDYDNSGLVYGNPEKQINTTLVALDLTHAVLEEAIAQNAGLIIVHHPPIFKALKRFVYSDESTTLLIKAIKEDIAIYACHTNLDNVLLGVNGEIAGRLGLKEIQVLQPKNEENPNKEIGAGVIGNLANPIGEVDFLNSVKMIFHTGIIRHTPLTGKTIQRVAICGGSGKLLINNALNQNSDAYLTADLGYHDFFIPEKSMLLADIGHYESEQFTSDRLVAILNEKFPNFAVLKSGVNTNPVNYFL